MQSRTGYTFLAAISFFEAALPLPIITDPFLMAAILVDRRKVVRLTILTLLSSVLGGIAAFFTAFLFHDVLWSWTTPELQQTLQDFLTNNKNNTFILTLLGAITPVPYTISAWAIALMEGSLLVFILGSIVGRGVRYGIVAWCTYKFGPLAVSYAKRYVGLTSLLVFILVALYVWYKL